MRVRGSCRGRDDDAYYVLGPNNSSSDHAAALLAIASSGCKKLGLIIGGDSYDYPLTWRAMKRQVEVRHVVAADDWPCAVFSDRGTPPSTARTAWRPADETGMYEPVSR